MVAKVKAADKLYNKCTNVQYDPHKVTAVKPLGSQLVKTLCSDDCTLEVFPEIMEKLFITTARVARKRGHYV